MIELTMAEFQVIISALDNSLNIINYHGAATAEQRKVLWAKLVNCDFKIKITHSEE